MSREFKPATRAETRNGLLVLLVKNVQYSDADYFNLSDKDTRIATAHREQESAELAADQARHKRHAGEYPDRATLSARLLRLPDRCPPDDRPVACRNPRFYSLNRACRKMARTLDFSSAHIRRAQNLEANEPTAPSLQFPRCGSLVTQTPAP